MEIHIKDKQIIHEIAAKVLAGQPLRKLAKEYGYSAPTITKIAKEYCKELNPEVYSTITKYFMDEYPELKDFVGAYDPGVWALRYHADKFFDDTVLNPLRPANGIRKSTKERNKDIFKRVMSGESFIRIGGDYDMSRQRVAQIATQMAKKAIKDASNR